MCADFASQRLPLRYCQDDMENARLRIGLSILRGHEAVWWAERRAACSRILPPTTPCDS